MRVSMTRTATGVSLALMLAAATPGLAQQAPVQPITPQERAQGDAANGGIVNQYGGAYTGPQNAYVEAIARKVAVRSGLSTDPKAFTVTILDSPIDNAFAVPGGYVYVTRGLLALANDEAELAGVLGHEVGHVAARHSRKRESAATRNAILAVLGQLAVGAVIKNTNVSNLLGRGIGTGSQLLTLGYSRGQEIEADTLGINYLASAGYDSDALASMLADLSNKTALDQRLAGRSTSTPAWASTHPEPGKRVAAALARARDVGGTDAPRNRAAYLAAIDGLLYGDNPRQGVVDGQSFRHPDLRIAFTAPRGFALSNGAQAVAITGEGAQAEFSTAPYAGDLQAYVGGVFRALSEKSAAPPPFELRRTRINGFDAAYATVEAAGGSGTVDATVFAIAVSPSRAYHFTIIAPRGAGLGPLVDLPASFRTLTAAEAAAIKPRFIRIVTVKKGETAATIATRMAFPDARLERFRALNGLAENAVLKPGDKVKIVGY